MGNTRCQPGCCDADACERMNNQQNQPGRYDAATGENPDVAKVIDLVKSEAPLDRNPSDRESSIEVLEKSSTFKQPEDRHDENVSLPVLPDRHDETTTIRFAAPPTESEGLTSMEVEMKGDTVECARLSITSNEEIECTRLSITSNEEVLQEEGSPKRDGYGIYSWKWMWKDGNGYNTTYQGQWKDGEHHGQGQQTWDDGRVFVGQFRRGLFHGQGRMEWTIRSGTYKGMTMCYEGEYREDKRHGHGKFVWANGKSYEGQWAEGRREGRGLYTDARGKAREGIWENDVLDHWIEDEASSGAVESLFTKMASLTKHKPKNVEDGTSRSEPLEVQTTAMGKTPSMGIEKTASGSWKKKDRKIDDYLNEQRKAAGMAESEPLPGLRETREC